MIRRALSAIGMAALALAALPARAADNEALIVAWIDMPQTCKGIAGFKARFGTRTTYAKSLADLSKKLNCTAPPVKVAAKDKERERNGGERPRQPPPRYLPVPQTPPSNRSLGDAAANRNDYATARYYYNIACDQGTADTCFAIARYLEINRANPFESRAFHEKSCLRSLAGQPNFKTYCGNAGLVFRHTGFGSPNPPLTAYYYLRSGQVAKDISAECASSPLNCDTLLKGLSDKRNSTFVRARELADWLCFTSTNTPVATNACELGSRLSGAGSNGTLSAPEYERGELIANRGCHVLGNRASCINGLMLTASDNYGRLDPAKAYAYFVKSGNQLDVLDCNRDPSVCHNLGNVMARKPDWSRPDFPNALALFAAACNGSRYGPSCLAAAQIYENKNSGMANASYASQFRNRARDLGCNSLGRCSRGF